MKNGGWELIDSQVDTVNLLNLGWLREYDGYTTIDYSILCVNMKQRSHHMAPPHLVVGFYAPEFHKIHVGWLFLEDSIYCKGMNQSSPHFNSSEKKAPKIQQVNHPLNLKHWCI